MYTISKKDKAISVWLFAMCIAIIMMVFIGGLTRLTDSGLSITEWKPITGIMQPLSNQDWQLEFDKYKQSPEYIKHNSGMSLEEFKTIYLLEFYHRIAGRITGLLYLLPLIFFMLIRKISCRNSLPYIVGLCLMLAQGFMGWYMVKSGLVSDPHVSHFRLASHLMLAVFIYMIIYWQFLKNNSDPILLVGRKPIRKQKFLCLLSIIFLLIQMIFGAFVAGLNAGLIYNSFPLMGEFFVPSEISYNAISLASFSDPVFIQLVHRICAYILSIVIIVFCFISYRIDNKKFTRSITYVIAALLLQMFLGIMTILYVVPIYLALLHQLGAIFLLSCLLWSYFLLSGIWNEE